MKRLIASAALSALAVTGLASSASAAPSERPTKNVVVGTVWQPHVVAPRVIDWDAPGKAIDWDAPAPTSGDDGTVTTQRIDWD